jgi:hypothetical protein
VGSGLRFLSATLLAVVAAAVGSTGAGAAVPTTWCGLAGPQSTADRKPDLTAGEQVTVVYARPNDQPDRIATFGSAIATDMASIDAWWRQQDAMRTLNFDLFGFPGCSGIAGLDIADVVLPHDSTYYSPLAGSQRYTRIAQDMGLAAFASEFKKYVVYFDGPLDTANTCGQSAGDYFRGPDYAVVYLRACSVENNGDRRSHTALHELLHALGAVGVGAPNECPAPDTGHVCDNALDILYPFLSASTTLDNDILDYNRNDYYGTNGPEDLRRSGWVSFLDAKVKSDVVLTGTGTGTVQSDVPGIDCPALCSNTWNLGTLFTLSATAGPNSRFVKWTGPCANTPPTCVATMSAAVRIEAFFAHQFPLTLSVDASRASGTVISTPAGVSCPGKCVANFDQGELVTFVAQPGTGSRLEAWGGACSGRGECTVTVDQAKAVTATFGLRFRRLTTSIAGKGKIISSPAGIACPSRCIRQFDADSTISLRAVPAKGYKLSGWSGACKGTARCTVTLSGDAKVRATFKRR